MRIQRHLSFLLLLAASPCFAQTPIQKNHCNSVSTCAFTNNTVAGDLLLAVGRNLPGFTSNEGWTGLTLTDWYGGRSALNYATAQGGADTLTFASTADDVIIMEFPPATFDSVSSSVLLCCSPSAPVGPLTTAAANELLVLWVSDPYKPTLGVSAGFTMLDTGDKVTVETQPVTPGTYTAVVPAAAGGWGARLAAFKLTPTVIAPPPKFQTLTFGVQLVNCTKCDGTDYAPLASASIYQGASFALTQDGQDVCAGTLNANAQASCTGPVNVTPAIVDLTYQVNAPSGTLLVGSTTAQFPSILAAGAATGNVKLVVGFDAATMTPRAVQLYTQ